MLNFLLLLLFSEKCAIIIIMTIEDGRGSVMPNSIFHQVGWDVKYREWHTNEDNMIMYIHHGDGAVVCGDEQFAISEGALLFIGLRKYHYTMPETYDLYDRSKILISAEEFSRILNSLADSSLWKDIFTSDSLVYAVIPEEERPVVESLYEEIRRFSTDKNYSDIVFISCVMKLLFYLHKNILENVSPSYGSIYKAIAYINENIFEDITIDDVCAAAHMSKYHFCRVFKNNTGQTVMSYILKTRIVLARTMLKKENLTVTEVSRLCGFSSVSYFCRVFKEETGVSPLKYKKIY